MPHPLPKDEHKEGVKTQELCDAANPLEVLLIAHDGKIAPYRL